MEDLILPGQALRNDKFESMSFAIFTLNPYSSTMFPHKFFAEEKIKRNLLQPLKFLISEDFKSNDAFQPPILKQQQRNYY